MRNGDEMNADECGRLAEKNEESMQSAPVTIRISLDAGQVRLRGCRDVLIVTGNGNETEMS